MEKFEPKETGLKRTVWLFEHEILVNLEKTDLKDHHKVLTFNIFSMEYELNPEFDNGRADAIVMRDTANHWLKMWFVAFQTCASEKMQSRQAEVDELFQENTRLKYLVGEKIGHPSARDLLDAEVQRQFDEQTLSSDKEFMTDEEIENLIKNVLKDHDENPNKYWPNLFKQIDDLKAEVDEKDKRIEELERSCISYKNQRDDNAQKLMVKSVHYNSIQEELAKLKDRLELAHHLATQSTWSSLKQLKKVVKALRGEHE